LYFTVPEIINFQGGSKMSDDFNKFDENEEEDLKKKVEGIDLANDEKYSKNYSETDFWDKLTKYAKKAGFNVISYALALYYIMGDPKIDIKTKGVVIAALGYLILPIDIIPDFLPGIGFADDLLVLGIAIQLTKSMMTEDIVDKVYKKINEWFEVKREDVAGMLK
jgi:uncharacterized membrane protein YkvA (DUF1232 family)